MASFETTELKLGSTPTRGEEAHKSPYYRRLVSAGYKGFLQGTLGGASLYGLFGLVIGGLAAIPFAMTGVGPAAFLIAPAFGGLGLWKGADTFGQIGSIAAITAESSDLAEQRRYLLDMYYDLPNTPDGNARAETIKKELLARATDQGAPPHMFHWKTVLIGAVIGVALVTCILLVTGGIGPASAAGAVATKIAGSLGIAETFGLPALAKITALALGIGGATAGGLAGATIGIDRYYIRKWFDHTQDIVHPSSHDFGIIERQRQVARLGEATKEDQKTKQQLSTSPVALSAQPQVASTAPAEKQPIAANAPIASLDTPSTRISGAHLMSEQRRKGLAEIHNAMGLTNA